MKREYCKWDYKLIKALYLFESQEVDGHPAWVQEADNIAFIPKKQVLRSAAVVELAQARHQKAHTEKNPEYGARFYAEAKLTGGDWPRREDWLKARSGKPDNTESFIDEMAKIEKRQSEAEDRARAKIADDPVLLAIVEAAEKKLGNNAG